MDDAELLRHYTDDGSEESFAELVRRHVNLVYAAALRRVGDDTYLAEDVTQKVFVALARQASSVSDRPELAGWLYTASRFTAAQVVRTERRRKMREQKAWASEQFFAESTPDPEWGKIRPVLDAVMDRLNASDREAVLLRFFVGHGFAEIGRNLGLTEEAARKRVARALDKLRVLLAKRGVSSTSAAAAIALANHAAAAAPPGLADAVTGKVLAAAAGSGAPGSLLWRFFGAPKFSLGAAGILGLAVIVDVPAIGVAIHESGAARRAEASLAAADGEYEAQLGKLRSLERTAEAADQNRVRLLESDQVPARDPKSEGRKFLAEFPQARAMLMESGMAADLKINGSFYRWAGLAPEQIDRFEKALVSSWIDNLALTPALISAGGRLPDDQARELLGDAAFRKYQDYRQMADAHDWTGAVARDLNYAGSPLSSEQTDQLARIFAANSPAPSGDQPVNWSPAGESLAEAAVDWGAALAQAKGVLSASQWETAEPEFLNLQFNGALGRARQILGSMGTPAAASN